MSDSNIFVIALTEPLFDSTFVIPAIVLWTAENARDITLLVEGLIAFIHGNSSHIVLIDDND